MGRVLRVVAPVRELLLRLGDIALEADCVDRGVIKIWRKRPVPNSLDSLFGLAIIPSHGRPDDGVRGGFMKF